VEEDEAREAKAEMHAAQQMQKRVEVREHA